MLTICVGITPAIVLPAALHGDKGAAQIAAAGFVALLFVYFWLSRFRLTITPDALTYSSLFTGERVIRFSEITASDIFWQGTGRKRPLLEIKARGGTTRINFKVFSREAVTALFHLAGPNLALQPTADR